MELFFRKLKKGANRTNSINLPARIVRALNWRKAQRLQISKQRGTIIIRDAKTKKTKTRKK